MAVYILFLLFHLVISQYDMDRMTTIQDWYLFTTTTATVWDGPMTTLRDWYLYTTTAPVWDGRMTTLRDWYLYTTTTTAPNWDGRMTTLRDWYLFTTTTTTAPAWGAATTTERYPQGNNNPQWYMSTTTAPNRRGDSTRNQYNDNPFSTTYQYAATTTERYPQGNNNPNWYMSTTTAPSRAATTTERYSQGNNNPQWYMSTTTAPNRRGDSTRNQYNDRPFTTTYEYVSRYETTTEPRRGFWLYHTTMVPTSFITSTYSETLIADLKKQGYLKCPDIFTSNLLTKDFNSSKVAESADVTVISNCDPPKHFILTSSTYGNNEVWRACAEYNAVPATIQSEEQLSCLTAEYTKQIVPFMHNSDVLAKFGNGFYWNAYIDLLLNGTFISCTTGEVVKPEIKVRFEGWSYTDACSKLNLKNTEKGTGISRHGCQGHKLPVICEAGEVTARLRSRQLMLDREIKCNSKKAKKHSRFAYPLIEEEKLKESGLLKCPSFLPQYTQEYEANKFSDFSSVGKAGRVTVINECDSKVYLLTKHTVDYADIWQECGSFGLVPATIETAEEIACISDNFVKKYDGNKQYLRFWTSQIDLTLSKNFTSCVTRKEVSNLCWSKSQPDNENKDEACVTFDLPLNNYGSELPGLRDNSCDLTSSRVICESGVNAHKFLHKRVADPNYACLKKTIGEKKLNATRSKCSNMKVMEESTFTKLIKDLKTIRELVKTKTFNI